MSQDLFCFNMHIKCNFTSEKIILHGSKEVAQLVKARPSWDAQTPWRHSSMAAIPELLWQDGRQRQEDVRNLAARLHSSTKRHSLRKKVEDKAHLCPSPPACQGTCWPISTVGNCCNGWYWPSTMYLCKGCVLPGGNPLWLISAHAELCVF